METKRVLGVYAHPDDADIGAGATLANLVRGGAQVTIVLVTSGDEGGFEAEGQDRIFEVRRQEQIDAAAQLGIDDVVFLEGYRDGSVKPKRELVKDVVAEIRKARPSLILTMSPEYNWNSVAASHPDHRAVGAAVVDAVYPAARNPFAFPELLAAGLEPWTVEEVWFQGHKEHNQYVAVDPIDVEKKIAAVRCHASQFEDIDVMENYVRSALVKTAAESGIADATAAESFFRWETA